MKEIEVKYCDDCPFLNMDCEAGQFCGLNNFNINKIDDIDTIYYKDKLKIIPKDCILNKEEITVKKTN